MASHSEVANRWADKLTGITDKGHLKGSRVFVHVDKLYSYGTHFELARFVRPKKGRPFFLLNGDTYSVTTSRHQADTRAAVARHAERFPSIIVPYSALESAGINPDSIVAVSADPERTEETKHRVTVPGLVTLADDKLAGRFGWNESNGAKHAGDDPNGPMIGPDGARYSVTVYTRGYDYSATVEKDCGACGGAGRVNTAGGGSVMCSNPACVDGKVTSRGGYVDYDPPRVSYYRDGSSLSHVEGDTFEYSSYRHFLGAAVFSAEVTEYSYRPCKAHADNGRGFCDSCGWNVGASPVSLRSGESVRHGVRGEAAPMIETKRTRRAYFLSAFDSNERHPHYFLAELPAVWDDPAKTRVRPVSVADAFRYLMPAQVRYADGMGADVKRQGDIFAYRPADMYWIEKAHAIAFRNPERNASIPLDGSGRHIVSELVKLTSLDGRTDRYFGRGRIVHNSGIRSWNGRIRGREHEALKLGDSWHEFARNLVPMAAPNVSTASGRFRRRAPGVPTVRAWSIIGRID
jgi:hypothetical protein